MASAKTRLKRPLLGLMAAMFMLFASAPYAFTVEADTSTPAANASCTPVTPASTGVTRPTGSDASTYTYNSCTGLYVNQYYTWSPATQSVTPITPYVYTCNTSNWKWTYQKWVYIASTGTWQQVTVTVSQLPVGAEIGPNSLTVCAPPPPVTVATNVDPNTSDSTDSTTNTSNGPNATTSTDTTTSNSTTLDSTNTATLDNQVNSQATSGNAAVEGNTSAGDAITGDASSEETALNSLQSSTSAPITTFVANIDGDVQGNLIVDPSQLQPASGDQTLNTTNNLTVNSQNTGQINNDVTLDANSGNATVADNTSAGSATSGNAEAIANVVNMIDSVISSGQSFIGVININGNLTGDILMPQNFLNSLIASNAPSTTVDISNSVANSLGIKTTNNETINNNVASNATSGNAKVSNNTSAGTATTGNASTAVTIFNLTGNEIIGTNCLLVFVNVSGTWVGVILNTPAGVTAAALGGDTTESTTNNTNIDATNNDSITNNVNVAAESGNATVAGNTEAGDATSGNAETAVNFLNLDNTQFDLTGWFGILFINVFGSWIGNFGVYTPPDPSTTTSASSTSTTPHVFSFVPKSNTATGSGNTIDSSIANAQLTSAVSHVLGDSTVSDHGHGIPTPAKDPTVNDQFQIVGIILVAVGLSVIGIERFVSLRQTHR